MTVTTVDRFGALIADASEEEVGAIVAAVFVATPTRRVKLHCPDPRCGRFLSDSCEPTAFARFPSGVFWRRVHCQSCGKWRLFDLATGEPRAT